VAYAIPRPIWPAPITAALFIGASAAILSLVYMVDKSDEYCYPSQVEPRQGPSGNLITGEVHITTDMMEHNPMSCILQHYYKHYSTNVHIQSIPPVREQDTKQTS
jgi:hypothetical protein